MRNTCIGEVLHAHCEFVLGPIPKGSPDGQVITKIKLGAEALIATLEDRQDVVRTDADFSEPGC